MIRKFFHSVRYAFKGFLFVFQHEQNFRLQVAVGAFVILLMGWFHVSRAEAIVLILVITAVLTLEILNTTFEAMIDVLKPRMHHYVEIIKDTMAAAVLLTSLSAAVIGS